MKKLLFILSFLIVFLSFNFVSAGITGCYSNISGRTCSETCNSSYLIPTIGWAEYGVGACYGYDPDSENYETLLLPNSSCNTYLTTDPYNIYDCMSYQESIGGGDGFYVCPSYQRLGRNVHAEDCYTSGTNRIKNLTQVFNFSSLYFLQDTVSGLKIEWIFPTGNINVTQFKFFNMTVNVTCYGADCGEIDVTLANTGNYTYYPNSAGSLVGGGSDNDDPPQLQWNSVSSGGITNISSEDGLLQIDVNAPCAAFSVIYKMNDKITEITELGLYSKGYSNMFMGTGGDYKMWVYNYTSSSWKYLVGHSNNTTPTPISFVVTSGFNDLINSSGNLQMAIIGNMQGAYEGIYSQLYTDVISINVTTRAIISNVTGDLPFYTNETNPFRFALNSTKSRLITWWINATGQTNRTWSFYSFANLTSNGSIYNTTTSTRDVTIIDVMAGAADATPPYFTTIPTNLTINYTQGFGVDFDAADETAFDSYAINWTTLFTINQSGWLTNSTPNLAVGTYLINVTINDSSNNLNSTIWQLIVNKSTPTLTFLANGGTSNLTLTYPQQVNITAIASAGTVGLDKDNVDYLANNGLNVTLGVGSYIFRANITGNENYTDVGYSYYNITITQASQSITPLLNGINSNLVITYPQQFNASYTGTNYTYVNITANGTEITKDTNYTYGVGVYNITWTLPSNQNYSGAFYQLNLTITQASSSSLSSLLINGTAANQTGSYGVKTNVSFTLGNSEQTFTLYQNGVDITAQNNVERTLSAGDYNFTAIVPATQNYSAFSITRWSHIGKIASAVYTYLNNSRANITIYNNTTIWLNGTRITGSGIIKLYNNGTLINSGASPLSNFTAFNITGLFNITTIYEATENYTSSYETWWVTVGAVPDTTNPNITIIEPTNNSILTLSFVNFSLNVSAQDDVGISAYWYSLDNGLTNTTFLTNQTWVSFPQQEDTTKSYTITACVNDTSDNKACDSVFITIIVPHSGTNQGSSGGGGTSSSSGCDTMCRDQYFFDGGYNFGCQNLWPVEEAKKTCCCYFKTKQNVTQPVINQTDLKGVLEDIGKNISPDNPILGILLFILFLIFILLTIWWHDTGKKLSYFFGSLKNKNERERLNYEEGI